jgi:hypothetical protein
MGDAIQVNHVAERCSSHTQMHARSRRHSGSAERRTVREKLIAALVEVVAEGGDPRLS